MSLRIQLFARRIRTHAENPVLALQPHLDARLKKLLGDISSGTLTCLENKTHLWN